MFEKLTALFYRVLKTRGVAECPFVFRPDKTRAASFLKDFKNIPRKACPSRLRTMVPIVRGEYQHIRKTSYALLVFFIYRILMRSVLSGYNARARGVLWVF